LKPASWLNFVTVLRGLPPLRDFQTRLAPTVTVKNWQACYHATQNLASLWN